eukprot:TRINITY_DN9070_c0_g1_i1.p1 TRINITY_DN9070_c0_g1~~TRINITY_DN9070_c0_g1_i1.p1  ORF type:complete len:544 (+),score=130.86 TRINITY_DN9070_c0_g1_i1:110-1741(+)
MPSPKKKPPKKTLINIQSSATETGTITKSPSASIETDFFSPLAASPLSAFVKPPTTTPAVPASDVSPSSAPEISAQTPNMVNLASDPAAPALTPAPTPAPTPTTVPTLPPAPAIQLPQPTAAPAAAPISLLTTTLSVSETVVSAGPELEKQETETPQTSDQPDYNQVLLQQQQQLADEKRRQDLEREQREQRERLEKERQREERETQRLKMRQAVQSGALTPPEAAVTQTQTQQSSAAAMRVGEVIDTLAAPITSGFEAISSILTNAAALIPTFSEEKSESVASQRIPPSTPSAHVSPGSIFRLTPPEKRTVQTQGGKCVGCHSTITPSSSLDFLSNTAARYCECCGRFFCSKCHENDETRVPWRLVTLLDAKLYRVCLGCRMLIEGAQYEADINFSMLAQSAYTLPQFQEIKRLRRKLLTFKQCTRSCNQKDTVTAIIEGRVHYFEDVYRFSLAELADVPSGALQKQLARMVEALTLHVVSTCALCRGVGSYCSICNSSRLIYLFQDDFSQCVSCKAFFHTKCFEEKACLMCERRKKLEGQK